jgi:hypothetical protein
MRRWRLEAQPRRATIAPLSSRISVSAVVSRASRFEAGGGLVGRGLNT